METSEQKVTYPTIVTSRRVVRNQQPVDDPGDVRVAIVGDAPGDKEADYNVPFVGPHGQLLNGLLREVGLDRNRCFVGNVCQHHPPMNKLTAFAWSGPEIQSGITQLFADLATFDPTIIFALGGAPLHVLKEGRAEPKTDRNGFKFPNPVSRWRGSLFTSTQPEVLNRKCLASFHPAYVLREFSGYPLLKFDAMRCAQEAKSRDLVLPYRELVTNLDAATLCYILDTWPADQRVYLDIEGGLPLWMVNDKAIAKAKKDKTRFGWPCVSFCARPTKSYTIAWGRYSEVDHARLLRSFARLMFREDVPKCLQNQLYDNFVLSYGYRCPIRNVIRDTMISGWEIYNELPRGLATQASIYTRQPYWKDDSMYNSTGEGLFRGCALDSAITCEVANVHDGILQNDPVYRTAGPHYRKIIEMQRPFLYMELQGMKYNRENVAKNLALTNDKLKPIAERLEAFACKSLRGPKGALVPQRLVSALYHGENSAGFRYPPQYEKVNGRLTTKLTTDIEAILTLKRHHPDDQFLSDILSHRHLEGVRETLQILPDADGRVRCGYSLEAETGRTKCFTSPTGSGANLTTIQKALRDNYQADEGYDFFQCDLEGADGWTVAAHCARLGDSTMLDDYLAGMKPAKIIALMYYFGEVINRLSRSDLKWLHDNVFPIVLKDVGKWLYLGCKRVQHGSSYLMGIPTMILNVLKDSYKESGVPIYMSHADARRLQDLFFARYPGVRIWHNWAEALLLSGKPLVAASGQVRVFFGRRWGKEIKETVKEVLAHEPQANTTWATDMAMLNLWNDPENRQWNGGLFCRPLHQVHDALCGQWPQYRRAWARDKIKTWFRNPLIIAGIEIVIPFDGGFGPDWLSTDEKYGGTKI